MLFRTDPGLLRKFKSLLADYTAAGSSREFQEFELIKPNFKDKKNGWILFTNTPSIFHGFLEYKTVYPSLPIYIKLYVFIHYNIKELGLEYTGATNSYIWFYSKEFNQYVGVLRNVF